MTRDRVVVWLAVAYVAAAAVVLHAAHLADQLRPRYGRTRT